MLTDYIRAALERAEYEKIEDGSFFGRIPGLQGLWANAATQEACRRELEEALEDWLLVGLRLGHAIPVLDGIDLNGMTAA